MDSTQCKMARAALGWSGKDLADAAGVGSATIARFELGSTVAKDNLAKLRKALEDAGIRFIDGGVYRGGVCPPR